MTILFILLAFISITIEVKTKKQYALCFFIASFFSTILSYLYNPATAIQIITFLVLSALLLITVYLLKPKKPIPFVEIQFKSAVGHKGIVTKKLTKYNLGQIKFEKPIMGCKEWIATTDFPIEEGEEAIVIDILGNYLKVEPTVWK